MVNYSSALCVCFMFSVLFIHIQGEELNPMFVYAFQSSGRMFFCRMSLIFRSEKC